MTQATLSNTLKIVPAFGVGTFRLSGQIVIESVKSALDVGYRAIDTAQIYGNEADIRQDKRLLKAVFLKMVY